ncbi:MAG: DUF2950 domain-containing protein [Acetobacteraceae bacterium]
MKAHRVPRSKALGAGPLRAFALSCLLMLSLLAAPLTAQAATTERSFATAAQAVAALVAALRANDTTALSAVLGPGSEKLLSSGDAVADATARRHFLESYDQQHKLVSGGAERILLEVGNNDWQMSIPIVEAAGTWRFDSTAGAQELVDRRIGRNEIQAIGTLLGIVDAEKQFFTLTAQQGPGEFAERLVSTPGNRDGLYWPAASKEDESPLGPLVATAQAEGYPGQLVAGKPNPYQGYYFRILIAQGPYAAGGAKSYVENGRMTGGFAVIAWPAIFGASGIMTFIVNQDGTVFQKDLGSGTAQAVAAITTFDPDLSWTRIEVENR